MLKVLKSGERWRVSGLVRVMKCWAEENRHQGEKQSFQEEKCKYRWYQIRLIRCQCAHGGSRNCIVAFVAAQSAYLLYSMHLPTHPRHCTVMHRMLLTPLRTSRANAPSPPRTLPAQ